MMKLSKIKSTAVAITAIPLTIVASACARLDTTSQVDVKPIEVKPIHITVDVNVRIDRELDNFFAFEEEAAKPATRRATTAPATTQTVSQP
jgi:hypothetical protein